jgi:hypothetical protein
MWSIMSPFSQSIIVICFVTRLVQ